MSREGGSDGINNYLALKMTVFGGCCIESTRWLDLLDILVQHQCRL
jgi:hypothetical protein